MEMVIISSVNNYCPDELKCFVESLNDVGYGGVKIMLVHHDYHETTEYLKSKGWIVVKRELYMLQHIQRFKETHEVLKDYPNEKVLFLDCRDIMFNKNPEFWDLDAPIYVGIDGFFPTKYHQWGSENLMKSHPEHYDHIKDLCHLNSGIIYGDSDVMVNFMLDVYETALRSKQRIGIDVMIYTADDQIAVNVLCYTTYKDIVKIQEKNDPYFINMAATEWNREIDYYLYHQYDRIPDFNLNRKY
jgi:hypothetical protein